MAPFAKWPPRVNSVTKLDVVREERGLKYSRDQGTSFRFLGEWYYFFGDTFCFNPQGQYIPDVVCNNIAKISDVTKPALCRYDELDSTGKCYMFIPFIDDEIKVSNARCILWVFGGVVEVEPCVGFAWAEKCILHNDTGVTEYCGTVLAQIGLDSKTGRLCATRLQGTIFGSQEPRIGTLCNIVDGDYVYLFGPTVVTILARVAKGSVAVRGAYEFWNGKTWVKEYQSGAVLFQDMQQGHVFRSKLFGPSRPWVFIGSNKVCFIHFWSLVRADSSSGWTER